MNDTPKLKSPDEILRAALVKETQARDFYAGVAADCRIEIVRELVEKLKDEETKHIRMIEAMMTRLSLGRRV